MSHALEPRSHSRQAPWSIKWLVMAMLALQVALAAWSATRQSPTYDEVAWVPAGVTHWQLGRFYLARVNPPLSRMIAAAPVVLARPNGDWSEYSSRPGDRPEFQVGLDFMQANGARSFWLIVLGRWACIPAVVLGGWVCYWWATDLYGWCAGLLATWLWCFCPNLLAHAQLATPDMTATSLGLLAGYAFWRWLRTPKLERALASGLFLGLAQLAKTSWLFLFLLWPLLWCLWRLPWSLSTRRAVRLEALQLGMTLVLGLWILNLGYGFEGFGRRLGGFQFVSASLSGNEASRHVFANRFAGTWVENVPVLLPANYLLGIDQTKFEFEQGKRSYLRGEWRMGGWWYYYLYGLAIKVPLGTWLLGLLALATMAARRNYRVGWRDEIALLSPAAMLLLLVSSQTGFNHHVRYVLPVLPFAFIWMSRVARSVQLRHWRIAAAGNALLVWSTMSALWVYPHSLSYFNELAGGPVNGHAHLVDSNIDWGQDLLYLKRWLQEHPDSQPLELAYFGLADPRLAGIQFRLPHRRSPHSQQRTDQGAAAAKGSTWVAVSVTYLRGYDMPTFDGEGGRQPVSQLERAPFLQRGPVATAGYSIHIYRAE